MYQLVLLLCRMDEGGDSALLLALPDPCLLAVLQCCAEDGQRTLFSAARAHSRLHQAAVLALRSMTSVEAQQQQADGVLQYLSKHHKHIDSVQLQAIDYKAVVLRLLPANLQLRSLQLDWVHLQVHPDDGLHSVLRAAALKHLRLHVC
jgi:hypothetical protein